jgi:hypothetical protein
MKSFLYSILFLQMALLVSSCEKDPQIPNEEELITTLLYTLTPQSGADSLEVIFSFRDLDGDGGLEPEIIQGRPQPNTAYNGLIQLFNESVSPAINITNEILDEGKEHQFFYTFSDVDVTLTYADEDDDQNPIGIATSLTTGDPGDGIFTVTLRHLPDKFAAGVKNGDITNAGGETDIEITFPLIIE